MKRQSNLKARLDWWDKRPRGAERALSIAEILKKSKMI